ncbi:MAG TPA: helicase C-terminal domain-containing protein, partial [Chloroflexota bacterium]
RAGTLALPSLTRINGLAARLPDWPPAVIFEEALRERLRTHFSSPLSRPTAGPDRSEAVTGGLSELDFLPLDDPALREPAPLRPSDRTVPVESSELAALMAPGGAVATAIPGYEERAEQVRMMEAVAGAFNDGTHLLVEAGTGTGKSLAYLLPAVYFAARNGRHVVVSTNTLNLQDQLFHKDLPALTRSLPVQFKAVQIKGRSNYLCLRKWQALARSPNLTRIESTLLIKTLIWLDMTESGDRAELNMTPDESVAWPRVCAQIESCALGRCIEFRRGSCFVQRARKSAEDAHVIVVNHALLLSDLASSRILPDYSHLIIDEAHHLEEEATDQLGYTLSWDELSAFLASMHQATGGRRPAGLLADLATAIRIAGLPEETVASLTPLITAAATGVEAASEAGARFFEAVGGFLREHVEDRRRGEAKLRIANSTRTQPGWAEVEVLWSGVGSRLKSLERSLLRLENALGLVEDRKIPESDGIVADILGARSFLDTAIARGQEIVSEPSRNGIYWVTAGESARDVALCTAPLHVGEVLNALLFSTKESVVLTSATLTAEGCFDYIRERLSLEDASEMVLGSPFDYRRSTLMYLVHDIPEPGRPSYQRAIESAIADLASALQGRTLVLFTSHSQLRVTNAAIRARLEKEGIVVLAHGVDGSRRRLLQAFKGTPKAVLFGTSSFWEGIDVVGEALSCVVIVKLPFAVPTDPIIAARSESFDEPFSQYSVPQTILKFKQGFGRLIRSASDRGVVAILDSRLRTKFYGPAFMQSVPSCTVRVGPAANLVSAAGDWLRS